MKEFNEKRYILSVLLISLTMAILLTSQDDRVLNLVGWIVKYCCDIRFEIDDWNSSSHYESGNNEYVFRNVSRMVL